MADLGIVLQKIIISDAELPESHFGPPLRTFDLWFNADLIQACSPAAE